MYTDDNLTVLRLNIYRKFRKIFYVNIRIDNETFNLGKMLSMLQELAVSNNIHILEWPKDDIFFTICSIGN